MKNVNEMNRDERRAAKAVITMRSQAVIDAYQDSKTAREAVEALVAEYGYAEAVQAVATVINRVGLWDGRIYDGVREWAQSVGAPSHEEMQALDIYGVDSWIHSAHVNEIGMAMKRHEPTAEEPTEPIYTAEAEAVMNAEPEATEEEPTADPTEVINEARKALTSDKDGNRSAWGRGVTAYALELLDDIAEAIADGWLELDDLGSVEGRKRAMLNGAQDWGQYSWGGCSLIYNGDIAERLCNPSELKRTRGGEWRPNSREEWLDTQARALNQASRRASRALGEALKRRA